MRRIDWLPVLTLTLTAATFVDAMAWAVTTMDLLGRVFAVLIVTTVIVAVAWGVNEG